jgi:hypothetical protein
MQNKSLKISQAEEKFISTLLCHVWVWYIQPRELHVFYGITFHTHSKSDVS